MGSRVMKEKRQITRVISVGIYFAVILFAFGGGSIEAFARINRQGLNLPTELDETIIAAGDAQALDLFGWSVAISGDTVIVGAREEDGRVGELPTAAGAAYIFNRSQYGFNSWYQVSKLTAADAQGADLFGEAVAISGDTVVVGAIWEDGGPGDPIPTSGAAYIFERNQGGTNNWGQVLKIAASDAQSIDDFGSSVAISGDTVIVGAPLEDGGEGDPMVETGAAYIFDRNQGGLNNWGQVVKLSAGDAQELDYFGYAVAISGDTVVVGAREESGGTGDPLPNAGAAYIFERNAGGANNWGQVTKLTAEDTQAGDLFGTSVDIDGDTIFVGALAESGGPGDPIFSAGATYIFERNEGGTNNWSQVVKLTASDAQPFDDFGISVAINGDTVIAGAFRAVGGSGNPVSDAGAAYIFERDKGGTNNWGQVTKITASDAHIDDQFGFSVSTNGSFFIIGAPAKDGVGNSMNNAGAAYIYRKFPDNFGYLPVFMAN